MHPNLENSSHSQKAVTEQVRFHEGQSVDSVSAVDPQAAERYREDPIGALAADRRALFNVRLETSLPPLERQEKLTQAVEGYFDKIIAMDKSFPDTGETSRSGVPEYIPDGFVEMGTMPSLDPAERSGRPMNYVDKRAILEKYKDVFVKIYAKEPTDVSQESMDMTIARKVAMAVYSRLPYARDESFKPAIKGGILNISEMESSVCQQQALTSVVLLQAFGVNAMLSKNFMATQPEITERGPDEAFGWDHVSNLVKIGESWFMLDATNPDVIMNGESGNLVPGIFELSETPDPSKQQELFVKTHQGLRKYTTRHRMHWAVKRAVVA